MVKLKETLENTIQMIDGNVVLLYRQKKEEAFQNLEPMIVSIMNSVSLIQNYQAETGKTLIDENKLNTALTEAMTAMQKNDMVLFADIMNYEINITLKSCYDRI